MRVGNDTESNAPLLSAVMGWLDQPIPMRKALWVPAQGRDKVVGRSFAGLDPASSG